MKHREFQIGKHFHCGGKKWRCTDIGTRAIIAVPIDYTTVTTSRNGKLTTARRRVQPDDLLGPPYKLAENVFDTTPA